MKKQKSPAGAGNTERGSRISTQSHDSAPHAETQHLSWATIPIITPAEARGEVHLPPRLTATEILSGAAPLTAECFASPAHIEPMLRLHERAAAAGWRMDALSWPDGTRCLIAFPATRRAAHPDWGLAAYAQAREKREELLLAHAGRGGSA